MAPNFAQYVKMLPDYEAFLMLLAFLYLYFFIVVPNVVFLSIYYVPYPVPSISWIWENYISKWAIFRWPAYMVATIKKWHDEWHVRQSERLGDWKFMYMPFFLIGAITVLQIMSGSPIPVTYVIGHRMDPSFLDGDVVLTSGRRAPVVGDSVLYWNTTVYHPYISSKIPVITASEDDPLQIRIIKEIRDTKIFIEQYFHERLRFKSLILCSTGHNFTEECGEVTPDRLLGVVTLRVPWAALPLRYVQKFGNFLEVNTRTGQPRSLWKQIETEVLPKICPDAPI